MAKDGTITINEWSNGIGASPLVGFGDIHNLNISDIQGAIYPNSDLAKDGTTTITERPIAGIVFDGKAYMLDNDLRVWWRGGGTGNDQWESRATSFASGKLCEWRNYIVGGLTTAIHVLDNLGNETTLSGAITTAGKQMAIVLSDAVYIVGGNSVKKLEEKDGQTFDPSNSATFTITNDKLLLNSGATANCVTTWNGYLIIGDDKGNLYKWNGVSDLPEDIVTTTESTVQRLITVNRLVYAQLGKFGNWYYYDGIRVQTVKTMPDFLFKGGSSGVTLESEGVAEIDNKIYFGMDVTSSAGDIAGIYSIDLKNEFALQCEDQVTGGTDSDVTIGALLAKGDKQYWVGWEEETGDTSYGIDFKNSTGGYTGDKAYLESQYFVLTINDDKKTFGKPVITFAKQLVTNDSVKIYYRETLSDTYTLHQELTYASDGGLKRKTLRSLPALQSIQVKVVLNGSVQLTNIILK